MKTFSTTDARNKFGEFLDAGMVERVKLVRNNRVIGYFIPARDYTELTRTAAQSQAQAKPVRSLTQAQEETIALYSQGQIGASEAKADVGCDYRELISILAERGLALPHVDMAVAQAMASKALELMNIEVKQDQNHGSVHRG